MLKIGYSVPTLNGLVSGYYHRGEGLPLDFGGGGPYPSVHDLGVQYGWVKANDDIIISISGGLSFLAFEHWESPVGDRTTIGVPVEGQFLTRSSETIAWGFSLYGNFNTHATTGGVTFCIRIG